MEVSAAAYNHMHPLMSHAVWAAGAPFGGRSDVIAQNPDSLGAFRAPVDTRRRAGNTLFVLWSKCVPSFTPFKVDTVEISTCEVTLQSRKLGSEPSKDARVSVTPHEPSAGSFCRSCCPHPAASRRQPGGRQHDAPQSCPGLCAVVSHPLRTAFKTVAGSAHSRPGYRVDAKCCADLVNV